MESNSAKGLWAKACSYLSETLSQDVYDRWISVIEADRLADGGTLVLKVSNDFYQTWLEEHYLGLIREAIAAASGEEVQISFVVDPTKAVAPAPVAARPAEPAPHAKETHKSKTVVMGSNPLDPKYAFENFVVGSSNHFAHASALAVSQAPGRAYNPLFIYGGVGLGKTHLMQAIGINILKSGKGSICCTSCEAFTNEFIDALQKNELVKFRGKYRNIDLLLIDDIHFLAQKERIQEEFFHTFNELHNAHKQIVLTSDRPASEIANLQKRLVSRFEWGQVTELELPDIETRIAILRKKQAQMNLHLPDEILHYIAEHVRSNIRRLEGALIRAASYASLTKRTLTVESVEHLLRDAFDQERQEALTIEAVQRAVAEYYDVRLGDMTSKQRPQSIAFPRQVAMYLCRSMTDHSLPTIGNAFGRNHATVLHAYRSITGRMKEDATLRQTVLAIKQKLGTR